MKASVIGATGFAGAELLRLLDGHPEVELAAITSESSTGENIAAMYPHLSVRIETALGSLQEIEQIADKSDVIFYCFAAWSCDEDRQAVENARYKDNSPGRRL